MVICSPVISEVCNVEAGLIQGNVPSLDNDIIMDGLYSKYIMYSSDYYKPLNI
jgi:hypothetical protein